MTNTNLKAQIDSHITNKTQVSSINHTAVGNDIKAVVDYIDQEVSNITISDASNTSKGILKISGDLAGTADSPIVPGLSLKENISNKSTSLNVDGSSDSKYPSAKATKDYADSLVVGLIDDRGNYTPGVISPGVYPGTGGSGIAGAIKKGDLWYVASNGFLGTTAVTVGSSFRALVDNPAQDPAKWNILNTGLGYVSENQANKDTDVSLTANSDVKYPSQKAIKTYVNSVVGDAVFDINQELSGLNSIKENLANKSTNVTTDAASDVKYPSVKAVKTYVDNNIVSLPYNEYVCAIYQTGASNPIAQTPTVDTISSDVVGEERFINYSRISAGKYTVSIAYKIAGQMNRFNLSINGNVKIISKVFTTAGPYTVLTYTFETYTPAGVLSDGLLSGEIGSSVTIKGIF